MAADLNAGIAHHLKLGLEAQDEIGVLLLGAEERIPGRVGRANADDHTVPDAELGEPAAGFPAGEVLAVKNRREAVSREGNRDQKERKKEGGKIFFHEIRSIKKGLNG